MEYYYLFKHVTVIDGSGGPEYRADLAVAGDRIAAIAPTLHADARTVIDGQDRALAPGFIDVHTHDDINVIRMPAYLPKISQGITTVIVGNCGISAAGATLKGEVPDPMNLLGEADQFIYPTVDHYARAVSDARPAVNVGTLVGHTALRQGALGLSTGLAYATAFASTTEEVMALAEELTDADGLYTTHLRSEFAPILDAMDEAFRIGRHGRVPVLISHHKCAGAQNWGRTRETLKLFDKVRLEQDVSCDCYPYSASSSTLDKKQITDEFDIVITWSTPHPEVAGRKLAEVAADWSMTLQEAGAIYYNMDEQDVRRVLSYPVTLIGSDGLPNDPMPHPRLWVAFPRVLGHYSRDEKLFPLTTAIHKMTGLSAARFNLSGRGLVREGYFADLVLFDPQTVAARATFAEPQQPAAGIDTVMVNGIISYGEAGGWLYVSGQTPMRHGEVVEGGIVEQSTLAALKAKGSVFSRRRRRRARQGDAASFRRLAHNDKVKRVPSPR